MKKENEKFYYTTDYGEKIYLMDYQAEQIYRQREAYYKACDMSEMIKDEFSDNKQLMQLTTGDLRGYSDVFADQLEMYEDMGAYLILVQHLFMCIICSKQDKMQCNLCYNI